MKVLTAEIAHETNTFCALSTTIANFEEQAYFDNHHDVELSRKGTKSALGSTFEAAERFDWLLTAAVCATSNPSGRVTLETFERIYACIDRELKRQKFDGVLLHLHGAMVADVHSDAEGEILRRIREDVGAEVPIIVTLDLHGNISPQMCQYANCFIAVRTYPHVDFYERGWQAAELLEKAMNNEVILQTVIAKRPMLKGLDGGKTNDGSPMKVLIIRGERAEEDPTSPILVVSVCAGFTAADVYDIGPSVTVTVDLKENSKYVLPAVQGATCREEQILSIGQHFAEKCMDYVWETRDYVTHKVYSIEEAVAHCRSSLPHRRNEGSGSVPQDPSPVLRHQQELNKVHQNEVTSSTGDTVTSSSDAASIPPESPKSSTFSCTEVHRPTAEPKRGPIVLADITDNPGSGHYGDTTAVLAALLASEIENVLFYAIYDPFAVKQAINIGIGQTGVITLGGRICPEHGGYPLTLKGKVVTLSDGCFPAYGPMGGGVWQTMGLSVLFRVQGVDICIISNNGQLLDTAQITSLGVDPIHKSIIAVKSKQHFRACLEPIASEIRTVDGGGLGSAILKTGSYEHVRRPIWPLDEITEKDLNDSRNA